MPSSHDDLLTPTEHEAAQLLVTLAWQLDGGQLASADQCWPDSAPSPPTTSPWRASCCSEKSRTASHRHFSGRRSRSSTTSARGSPAEQGRPASTTQSETQAAARFCRRSRTYGLLRICEDHRPMTAPRRSIADRVLSWQTLLAAVLAAIATIGAAWLAREDAPTGMTRLTPPGQ
jgi:hypothetical protein